MPEHISTILEKDKVLHPSKIYIKLTKHALRRMKERNLSVPYVYWAWSQAKEVQFNFSYVLLLQKHYMENRERNEKMRFFWGSGTLFVMDMSNPSKPVVVTLYPKQGKGLRLV